MRDLSKEKHLRFRVGIYEVFFENPNDIDYRKKERGDYWRIHNTANGRRISIHFFNKGALVYRSPINFNWWNTESRRAIRILDAIIGWDR
jgi:hypothetical protein